MRRRAVLLALATAVAWPAAAADAGGIVHWSDVRLHDGRIVRARELQGRTVVVEFWATWCPFCKKQNPYLQRLHKEHGGKGLVVLTFSIDRSPEAVAAYMMEHDYTFAAAMAGEQSSKWFPDRKGLPVVYVVDPNGKIVYHEVGELFEEDILGLARFAAAK
jgi:thiol-disulfide isomerase/thioredoxin